MTSLRNYQEEATVFLFPRNRGCVVAPAGSGKTVIGARAAAYAACRVWAKEKREVKLAWVCGTLEQKMQGIKALQAEECSVPVDIRVECYAAKLDLSDVDIVIVDECHHVPSDTLGEMLSKLKTDAILYGLTATPTHSDPLRNALVDLTFKEFFVIDRARVEASGHLIKGKAFMCDVDVPGQFNAEIEAKTQYELAIRMRRMPWLPRFEQERRIKNQMTQEMVQANEARNASAVFLTQREAAAGESVLVLVASIEHGKKLVERMPGSEIVNSKLPKKKRAQLVEDFRSGALRILVATSLLDEGADFPRASRLILVAGGRSAGKLEQRAGRVLRPFEGKNGGVIYDFLDRGATFAHAQAKARMRVYETLGYAPEIIFTNSLATSQTPTIVNP